MIEYHLDYGSGNILIKANDFQEALEKLNITLNSNYTQNNVRIKSAVRLN
ncbi:hypothetical protein [Chryseobacterium luquanense]|uniref:Uncharacterized protein n=1 Tax=Chryseobacterium luquanense TaxID=2983766 RepID=A0ABT3Y4T6_9FLAO|nr:hypothetical protein [Chryseobacterium luquanense]MCX8533086.1 hypothetical protein [Chryseobacterium luquanense]